MEQQIAPAPILTTTAYAVYWHPLAAQESEMTALVEDYTAALLAVIEEAGASPMLPIGSAHAVACISGDKPIQAWSVLDEDGDSAGIVFVSKVNV